MKTKPIIVSLLLLLLFCALPSYAFDIDWRSAGARAGFGDGRNDVSFNQYEAFVTINLPWSWELGSKWTAGTFLEGNAGALTAGGDSGFVGSIGGGFYFEGFKGMLEIMGGFNPTYISKRKYDDTEDEKEDLGGPLQFTSYLNINIIIKRHLSIGYRLQHMSNAGIYDANPGINQHMIAIGYRF